MLLQCDCTRFEVDLMESQSHQEECVLLIRRNGSVTNAGKNGEILRHEVVHAEISLPNDVTFFEVRRLIQRDLT